MRVRLPHTCTQDGWFLQPKRRPARLPRRAVPLTVYVGVVECASASPYTYSTHRFPDERTPIESLNVHQLLQPLPVNPRWRTQSTASRAGRFTCSYLALL